MIWIEVRRKNGELRYRWPLKGPKPDPAMSFEERVRFREELLTNYLRHFEKSFAAAFEPAEHDLYVVYASKMR